VKARLIPPFPPLAATKFLTDRKKVLYAKKTNLFKKTRPSIPEESNANLANPLQKGFCRRFALQIQDKNTHFPKKSFTNFLTDRT
jgi:hypothetical protein